jgi:hypothetical protein
MTTLEDRVAMLEQRLKLVDDKEAILRTIYQYSHNLDHRAPPDEFADCFTETAVWWSSTEGEFAGIAGGHRLEGRPAIADWFVALRGSGERRRNSKHYIVGPKINITGDTATAESYMLAVISAEDGPYIHAMARYFDTLVRCDDGRWRFQERHLAREGASAEAQQRRVG